MLASHGTIWFLRSVMGARQTLLNQPDERSDGHSEEKGVDCSRDPESGRLVISIGAPRARDQHSARSEPGPEYAAEYGYTDERNPVHWHQLPLIVPWEAAVRLHPQRTAADAPFFGVEAPNARFLNSTSIQGVPAV